MTEKNEGKFDKWFIELAKKYTLSPGDLEVLRDAGLVNIINGEAYRTNEPYGGKTFAVPLVKMKHISTAE